MEFDWIYFAFVFTKETTPFEKGEVLLCYLMWYSFGRFFIEGLRTDSLYFLGVIRISQLLSAVLFVGTLILFIWRRKKEIYRIMTAH